jgi:hypothetical protein
MQTMKNRGRSEGVAAFSYDWVAFDVLFRR